MRHAVYFAPRDTALIARLGARWLGRDAATGRALKQPELAGISGPEFEAATASARRYGFHATLKPPFRLAEGRTAGDLDAAVERLAASLPAVTIPGLEIARLGGFIALVPAGPVPALDALAGRVVAELDGFRAPPDAAEIARRRPASLSPRERAMLERWGYPHVFEEFRFHMTLTDALPPERGDALAAAAARHFAPVLGRPVLVDALTVFVEPRPAAPFCIHKVLPLAGGGRRFASIGGGAG
jgi:putative phosphonate metabolism protein